MCVCARLRHAHILSCVVAPCLIHTPCIIELASGFSPLWWRQRASRISCYQEAVVRPRHGRRRWSGSLGLPDVHAARFPRSSCPPPALPSGAGGLPALPLKAGVELGGRRQRNVEAKSRRCKGKMQDVSLHGGYYPSQPLIERNRSWKSCVQSLTFLLVLVHHVLSDGHVHTSSCTFSHTFSFAALK